MIAYYFFNFNFVVVVVAFIVADEFGWIIDQKTNGKKTLVKIYWIFEQQEINKSFKSN